MTGYSMSLAGLRDGAARAATRTPARAARARRLRALVAGRQTRADVLAAALLLLVSVCATLTNLGLTIAALPSFRECATATCTYGRDFDVLAATFIVSLLVGTTFGAHAVLQLLKRRVAWGYAALDALVSVLSLLAGVAWLAELWR